MTTNTNTTAGRLDYESMIALRAMDPARAERYKAECWKKYQLNRISGAIAELQKEYEENMDRDYEGKTTYTSALRQGIIDIPGIADYEEFKDIYTSAQSQLSSLDSIAGSLSSITDPETNEYDQPGMDELSSDEPDTQEIAVEEVEKSIIDSKIDTVEEEEIVSEEVVEAPTEEKTTPVEEEETTGEKSLVEYQQEFFDKYNKPVPSNKKSDIKWIASKL